MNRGVAKTVLLGIVCGAAVRTVTSRSIAAAEPEEQAVLRANAALEAALQKADKAETAQLLDAELTWVLPEGVVQTKREILAKLPELVAVRGDDAQVTERMYGQVAVVQVHRGQAHSLRVWAKSAEGWRLLHAGEIVQPAKPDASGPGIETPCINPCTTVPFKPKSAAEEAVLASWQQMETGAYNHSGAEWGAHAAEEFQVVSSWSNKPMAKADRVAAYDKLRENGVHANTVAPLVWAHMWEFGDTIFMLAEHTRYGGKPDIASRVWVNREGHWLLAVSYHTIVQAMSALTFQTTAPQ
jgi:uncharacterized protein DUF4440